MTDAECPGQRVWGGGKPVISPLSCPGGGCSLHTHRLDAARPRRPQELSLTACGRERTGRSLTSVPVTTASPAPSWPQATSDPLTCFPFLATPPGWAVHADGRVPCVVSGLASLTEPGVFEVCALGSGCQNLTPFCGWVLVRATGTPGFIHPLLRGRAFGPFPARGRRRLMLPGCKGACT